MPIKGLTDRGTPTFPKIGDIRKGAPKPSKGIGKDLTYFRAIFSPGEEEAAALFDQVYGPEPREINIFLPFDEIARNFEAWQEEHVASGLQHRCDGETCVLWRDENGEMHHTPKPCPGGCVPVGRLRIIVPELRRLAYLVVHTGSKWDIIELMRNLLALRKLTGNGLKGIPLVLKRRPRMVSTPRGNGRRARQEKWLLSIEADPRWVEAQLRAMEIASLPAFSDSLLLDEEVAESEPEEASEGELIEEPEAPPSSPFIEDEDNEPAEEPQVNGNRPYSPAEARFRLRHNAKWQKGEADDFSDAHRQPDDKQKPPPDKLVQRVAALMGKALQRPDAGDPTLERHSVLKYAFGVDSTALLTLHEAETTTKWLQAQPMAWIPSSMAAEECRLMLREAMKEAGQMELPDEAPEEDETEPEFPASWAEFAKLAVKQLDYDDMYQVIKALEDASIAPVSDAAGNCAFVQADAWTVLRGEKQ